MPAAQSQQGGVASARQSKRRVRANGWCRAQARTKEVTGVPVLKEVVGRWKAFHRPASLIERELRSEEVSRGRDASSEGSPCMEDNSMMG